MEVEHGRSRNELRGRRVAPNRLPIPCTQPCARSDSGGAACSLTRFGTTHITAYAVSRPATRARRDFAPGSSASSLPATPSSASLCLPVRSGALQSRSRSGLGGTSPLRRSPTSSRANAVAEILKSASGDDGNPPQVSSNDLAAARGCSPRTARRYHATDRKSYEQSSLARRAPWKD